MGGTQTYIHTCIYAYLHHKEIDTHTHIPFTFKMDILAGNRFYFIHNFYFRFNQGWALLEAVFEMKVSVQDVYSVEVLGSTICEKGKRKCLGKLASLTDSLTQPHRELWS